jgi:microcystin-dependent protein
LIVGGNLTVSGDLYATSFYATGNFYLDNYILIPAGTIIMSGCINAPTGWLQCDGQLLAKINYYELWLAIGNAYTDISSGTHFKVPDMQGRCAVGSGSGTGLTARAIGTSGGEERHTLTVAEMPSHNHGGSTSTNGDHTHSSNATGGTLGLAYSDGNNTADSADFTNGELNVWTTPRALTINNAGSHSHTISSQGSDASHNIMQPFMVVRYLIKY